MTFNTIYHKNNDKISKTTNILASTSPIQMFDKFDISCKPHSIVFQKIKANIEECPINYANYNSFSSQVDTDGINKMCTHCSELEF